jgi:hypothetical protein
MKHTARNLPLFAGVYPLLPDHGKEFCVSTDIINRLSTNIDNIYEKIRPASDRWGI